VVVPVVRGEWEPEAWLKEGELVLVYKKGDGSSLEHFRGIGLLSHAFKILEWAIFAGVWRRIQASIDSAVFGFIANRGTCQALWRIRAENDKRARAGKGWVWLSMDIASCFDTVLREVGLAAAEGLGVDPKWGERWKGLWRDLVARIRVGGRVGGEPAVRDLQACWGRGAEEVV
jgi:hypothetical protein